MDDVLKLNGEVFRICPIDSRKLEVSLDDGRTFSTRYHATQIGAFISIGIEDGKLIADTEKGICYSSNYGRSWLFKKRF